MAYFRNQTPCKYFQAGKCLKGNNCNFAHVYTNGNNGGNNKTTGLQKSTEEKYLDLTNDRNLDRYTREIELDMDDYMTFAWAPNGSSYGLAAPCPLNVIANRDFSSDESRFQYWQSIKQGKQGQYEMEITARRKDMEKCVNFVKSEAKKAARYVQLSARTYRSNGTLPSKPFIDHPLDLTGQSYNTNSPFGSVRSNPFANVGPFSSMSSNGAPPFGQSVASTNIVSSNSNSTIGQSPFGNMGAQVGSSTSVFGKPAFGSTAAATPSSPFGQNSNGNSINSNNNGSSNTPGSFGSQNLASNTFGKSTFGAQPFGNPSSSTGFGRPQQTTDSSSAFRKQAFGHSAFGQPSFGQSAARQPAFEQPAFGTSSFGQAATGQLTANQPAFGQSAFGTSPFGQAAIGQSSFGNTPSSQTAFGTSAFGQAASGHSPFGKPLSGQNTFGTSVFGQAAATKSASSQIGSTGSPFSQSNASSNPNSATQVSNNQNNTNTNFNSTIQPFQSINNGFSNSPFNMQSNSENSAAGIQGSISSFVQGLENKSELTTISDLSEKTIALFKAPKFELGNIPEVPPPRELVS